MPFREIFFENFLLRASHINTLNDPFEMEPSIEWWANLFLELKNYRFGQTKEEIFSYIRMQNLNSPWRHLGTDLFKEYGIISFSRGAHFVDYKEEIKLAELFNKRAENIENEGFFRFAITLRNIAKHYFSEAERIKEDY
ncbi:hypothetical protein CJ673_10180 [Aliarcobacter cryaerophilus]|jgi:hypothetical protein|uniref:Uncharacterized protein n=1 Tax=Aliarcobacter cryaerophilus TaxID=28198 RepID=A0A2S9T1A3_9BACT|nr:hypothetical protein [Aliarcobacter cryaerophilus]PRM92600.1 hypothetical protein CJ673_10180 [Aliarcobacter cryaerophilus]